MTRIRVSSRGQIVIPKKIRERLGIRPGTILNVSIEGKRIILEPTPELPEIFVELGERSGEILREVKRKSEEKIRKLLGDLGVKDNG